MQNEYYYYTDLKLVGEEGFEPITHGLQGKTNIAVWILNGFRNAPICPHDSVTRQVLDYIKLTRLLLLSYIVMRCWQ